MSALLNSGLTADGAATLKLMAEAMQREATAQLAPAVAAKSEVAALFDLSQRLLRADSLSLLFRTLAAGVKELTGCKTVIAASVQRRNCRVETITGVDTFNPHGERVRNYRTTCLAACADGAAPNAAVLKFLDADGRPRAVCLLEEDGPPLSPRHEQWAAELVESLGPVLDAKLTALRKSRLQRWIAGVAQVWHVDRRTACIAAGIVLAVALFPWPYQVYCDCEVQPVVRRHVAAPFDGVLQQSLCRPGDVVAAGQVLGRLDAKELNWELAGIKADRDRATKSRDVNLSAGKTAAAQIDRLEALRLDERRKLLEHRLTNLEVKSPIAGVVVSGDLERAEGAPVKIGQSLYEVAPLDKMAVEVLVPEVEIERVRTGQPLSVSLDSLLGTTLTGDVARIYPRAEVRDDANVFVLETELSNADGKLRPGMKGRAAVRTDRRPLAWIAAHRLFETAYRWLW